MLNLPYYKDLRAVNLLNDDETQEIIKIVRATGFTGAECEACEGEGKGRGRGRGGRVRWLRGRGVQHGDVGERAPGKHRKKLKILLAIAKGFR